MPTFDWQFEWELGDEARQERPAPEVKRGPNKSRRLFLLLAALALLLIGIVAYRRVGSWSERTVADVKGSLLSMLSLTHYAAARADEELFGPLLAAHSAAWADEQQLLVRRGLFYDRAPLGLYLHSVEPTIVDISLSPDLTSATVLSEQIFLVEGSPASPVKLRLDEFFQSHDQQWLRTAPEEEFWDGWIVVEGKRLTLGFPGRDADIGRRLARDLDNQLATMCAVLEALNCPHDLHVRVRLEKSLSTLVDMAERTVTSEGLLGIELPAPTLIGTPVDEQGYQALYRGYALHLIPAVIGELVGRDCCRQIPFHLALLDKQLAQLGLRSWPLDYETMSSHYFDLGNLNALWRWPQSKPLSEENRWQVYAFIDFLAETANDVPVAELQRQLSTAASFRNWVRPIFEGTYPTEVALRKEWLRFVYDKTLSSKSPPPIPLPGDIDLYCVSGSHRALFRLNLQAGAWSKIRALDDDVITWLTPLPYGGGIILLQQPLSGTESRTWTILRQNGEEIVIPIDALGSAFYPVYKGGDLPDQDMLVISTAPADSKRSLYNLIDLDSCGPAGCDLVPLPGLPIWSPGSQHTLISTVAGERGSFSLRLGDAKGQASVPVGYGTAPFWLDGRTYGYISSRSGRAEVMLAELGAHAPSRLLAVEELEKRLPETEQPPELVLRQVLSSPANSNLIFIDALSLSDGMQYIFSFDRRSKKVDLIFQLDDRQALIDFRFSPDGRYWTMSTHARANPVGSTWAVHLHAIEKNETDSLSFYPIPYATHSYDWSADGQWLVKVDSGFLSLIAPDYDYQEMIFFDQLLCTSAVWVHNTGNI